jgi:RHS repeat-associated protein
MGCSLSAFVVPALRKKREEQGTHYIDGASEIKAWAARLSAKQGTTTKESYTYDLVGNRLTSLGVSQYNYNSSNELTSTPSGSYTYDNNGNRKSDPSGAAYTWDYENRLTQEVLAGTGGTATFKYDPFGRRAQKVFTKNGVTTTTNYFYDGANILQTEDQNGALVARYVDSLSVDEPLQETISGASSYYEQDGLGSVSSISSSAGALANMYTYDSYGKITASSGTIANSFQFTGREYDRETSIYYYRARYYDESVGRFLSEDPIGFHAGLNFYEYAYNDSTTLDDPTGNDPGVIAFPWILELPEIPVAGQVAVAGTAGWFIGRGIGHIPIGNGDTVDDAVTDGFASILIYFAKGGKKYIGNEYVDEAKNMFGNDKDKICKWLDDLYSASGPAARQKIVKAQKYFGCRRCGGGGN